MIGIIKAFPSTRLLFVTIALILFTLQGCGGALFKVKPVVELPALPESSKSVTSGGITLRVAPLLSDEASQELFGANLPVAGILPSIILAKLEILRLRQDDKKRGRDARCRVPKWMGT